MSASSAAWQEEEQILAQRVTEEDKRESQAIESEAFAERRPEAIEKLLLLSFRAQFHDRTKIEALRLYVPEDYSARSQRFSALGVDLRDLDLYDDLRGVTVPALVLYGEAEPAAAGRRTSKARPSTTPSRDALGLDRRES